MNDNELIEKVRRLAQLKISNIIGEEVNSINNQNESEYIKNTIINKFDIKEEYIQTIYDKNNICVNLHIKIPREEFEEIAKINPNIIWLFNNFNKE
jgi:hypothetical protein